MGEVRHAEQKDIGAILELSKKFWAQTAYNEIELDESSTIQTIKHSMSQELLSVMEVDGEVVGFVAGVISPIMTNQDVLVGSEIAWYIEKEHRNDGLGKQLLTHIEESAREAGVTYWSMMVLEALDPEVGAAIYESRGYSPTERTYTKVFK